MSVGRAPQRNLLIAIGLLLLVFACSWGAAPSDTRSSTTGPPPLTPQPSSNTQSGARGDFLTNPADLHGAGALFALLAGLAVVATTINACIRFLQKAKEG